MALGMYIITGFAAMVGISALVFSWRLVNKFSEEKPLNKQDDMP